MKWFVVLLVLLVACQPFNLKPKAPVVPEVFKGVSGVDVSFAEISGKNIFMCQHSDVFVNLKNNGAFDVGNGFYNFIFENQIFKTVDNVKGSFALKGKSSFSPIGEFSLVKLGLDNFVIPQNLPSYSSSVFFQACYPYKTFAGVTVCVDPDVQNLVPVKACRVGPVVLSGGQGGPVEVVRVEPSVSPSSEGLKAGFLIYLRNGGSGSVIPSASVESACSDGKADFSSKVKVSVKLQDRVVECKVSEIVLRSGEDSVLYCSTSVEADSAFSSVLFIELDYGYVSSASLPILINKYPNQGPCA